MTSRLDCTPSELGVGVGRWGMPPGSSLLELGRPESYILNPSWSECLSSFSRWETSRFD